MFGGDFFYVSLTWIDLAFSFNLTLCGKDHLLYCQYWGVHLHMQSTSHQLITQETSEIFWNTSLIHICFKETHIYTWMNDHLRPALHENHLQQLHPSDQHWWWWAGGSYRGPAFRTAYPSPAAPGAAEAQALSWRIRSNKMHGKSSQIAVIINYSLLSFKAPAKGPQVQYGTASQWNGWRDWTLEFTSELAPRNHTTEAHGEWPEYSPWDQLWHRQIPLVPGRSTTSNTWKSMLGTIH